MLKIWLKRHRFVRQHPVDDQKEVVVLGVIVEQRGAAAQHLRLPKVLMDGHPREHPGGPDEVTSQKDGKWSV